MIRNNLSEKNEDFFFFSLKRIENTRFPLVIFSEKIWRADSSFDFFQRENVVESGQVIIFG